MARIRTTAHLQKALDKESEWRVSELANLKTAIAVSVDPRQRVLIRAAVPLTYSHWEGFVKRAATYYGLFLSDRGLTYGDLKPCFVGVETLGIVSNLHEIKRMLSTASRLTTQILELDKSPVSIDLWPRLKEIGNLNYDLFSEIVEFLDLTAASYSGKKAFIDETLISNRNKIAHGERMEVDFTAINSTINETIGLLALVKEDIENCVSGRTYLRAVPA